MKYEIEHNRHLNRYVQCKGCGWLGTTAKLVAKVVLRCPKCDGDEIAYVRPFNSEALQ